MFEVPVIDSQPPAVQQPARPIAEKRTNWSAPENVQRLQAAVNNWDSTAGEWLTLEPKMSFHADCKCVGIPKGTLHNYTQADLLKRYPIGATAAGRPKLADAELPATASKMERKRAVSRRSAAKVRAQKRVAASDVEASSRVRWSWGSRFHTKRALVL